MHKTHISYDSLQPDGHRSCCSDIYFQITCKKCSIRVGDFNLPIIPPADDEIHGA